MPSDTSLLARRVNDACLHGWPALENVMLDGWQARLSRGYTKRANSVCLRTPSRLPADGKIQSCEMLYAEHGLPTIFQLSSFDGEPGDGLDDALDVAGYGPRFGESRVFYRDLASEPAPDAVRSTMIATIPDSSWFDAAARIQGLDSVAQANSRAIMEAVTLPAAYSASMEPDGRIAAVAFGALHEGIVCLNSVATDRALQRRGHARLAVGALLDWAQRVEGATGACLPVLMENAAALALYRNMGFSTEIGRYSYRMKPLR